MKGHARRLYAALADKKRQTKKPWHEYNLDELRYLIDAVDKYPRWADLRRFALLPALQEINDYGTVQVKMTPQKEGRSIVGVRFDWDWKTLDAARVTDEENERHGSARHKSSDGTAPPLIDPEPLPALAQNIRDNLDDVPWKSWFAPCEFQDNGDTLTIIAPTRFHAEHMKSNYQRLLENCRVIEGSK